MSTSFIAYRGRNLLRKSLLLRFEGLSISSRRMMTSHIGKSSSLIFRQLFDSISFTYTYLLGDKVSKKAIIIDPVYEHVARDLSLIKELGLDLIYAANTHVHADHITGTGLIKTSLKNCQSVISKTSNAVADLYINDKDVLRVGNLELDVRSTPGHTNGCVTYVSNQHQMAFTGDALLIRGCGRTDFQEGSSETLYDSVHSQIFSLPDSTLLFPAHDYKGQTVTSVAEEKTYNPRLTKTKSEFVVIMQNLGLSKPKMIEEAVPANLACGL